MLSRQENSCISKKFKLGLMDYYYIVIFRVLTLRVVDVLLVFMDVVLMETQQQVEKTLRIVRIKSYQFLHQMFVVWKKTEDQKGTSLLDGVLTWNMVAAQGFGMVEKVVTGTTLKQKRSVMRFV